MSAKFFEVLKKMFRKKNKILNSNKINKRNRNEFIARKRMNYFFYIFSGALKSVNGEIRNCSCVMGLRN